jgi:hypothetical protein
MRIPAVNFSLLRAGEKEMGVVCSISLTKMQTNASIPRNNGKGWLRRNRKCTQSKINGLYSGMRWRMRT